MAMPHKLRRSTVAGRAPATTDLLEGELGYNVNDGALYAKQTTGGIDSIIKINGSARVVNSIAELKTLNVVSASNWVFVLGYYAAGDGGGGSYYYNSSGTGAGNGGSTIQPTAGGGLWQLSQAGVMSLRQFGAKGDYNGTTGTDDTAAFLAIVATGLSFHIPSGNFKVAPIGSSATYPLNSEPNRTSAAALSGIQKVTGNGASSILTWGSTSTVQAFFTVTSAVNVVIDGVSFVNGYGIIAIDPASDGSVSGTAIRNCFSKGQLNPIIGGRQYALDPAGSKRHDDLTVTGCKFDSPSYHAIMVSNCNRPKIFGNEFTNVTNGFCVDFSQGTRGGEIWGNTGDNVLHFCKVESSTPTVNGVTGDPASCASYQANIFGNNITNITQMGVFVNSHADRITITGNELTGNLTYGINFDTVTGISHKGQVTIANNTITGVSSNAVGIRYVISTGDLPPNIHNNNINTGAECVNVSRAKFRFRGNVCVSLTNGVVLGGSVAIKDLDISGNEFNAPIGLNFQSSSNIVVGASIYDNTFNCSNFSIYGAEVAGFSSSEVYANKVNYAASFSGNAIYLNNINACKISGNKVNMPSSAGTSIATIGTAVMSIISGNIATRAMSIASPDSTTTTNTTNNVVTAAYAA